MKYRAIWVVILLAVSYAYNSNAQSDSVDLRLERLLDIIELDSIVVKASASTLNVKDFIELCIYDTTFYQAFANLKNASFVGKHDVTFYNKRGKEKASYSSNTIQHYSPNLRTMEFFDESYSKKYKKRNGKFRYFTGRMYEHLFLVREAEKYHYEERLTIQPNRKGIAKYTQELKKLVFMPGVRADIPLINDEMEIFSEHMQKYYYYRIDSEQIEGVDCYVFKVQLKPHYNHLMTRVIVRDMQTYFEKGNLQILARKYHLKSSATIYSFDVRCFAKLTKQAGKYYPSYLEYDGRWDVPLYKPEIAKIYLTVESIN